MIARRAVLAAGLALAAGPVFAIDPGVASGHYSRDGEKIDFKHAIALSQDNAERLLDHGPYRATMTAARTATSDPAH